MDMSMRVTSGNTPFPVSVAPVERSSIVGHVVYTGSVAPFNEEDVYPRVTGRIVEMRVYPGDLVRAGQVLARLDSVELSSRVGEAEAGLATTQASRDPINQPGYLSYLDQEVRLDEVTRNYVEEALKTYRACCFKATAVLIGAALENLVMTPHMSGWTAGMIRRRRETIAQNIGRLSRGEPLVNVVA